MGPRQESRISLERAANPYRGGRAGSMRTGNKRRSCRWHMTIPAKLDHGPKDANPTASSCETGQATEDILMKSCKRSSHVASRVSRDSKSGTESFPTKRKTNGRNNMKLSNGELHQGDCLKLMKKIPDQSIDMILCDLPYGTTRNRWDSIIPLDQLWEHYTRVIKPRGIIALTSQGIFTAKLIVSNESWFRYKFVWVKSKPTNFLNARRQPLRQHEDVCIFYNQQPDYRPIMWQSEPYNKGVRKDQYTGSYNDFVPVQVKSDGERFPTDTLYCKTAESEPGGRVWHPTQKPVALGRYLIRMFTDEGDVVMDNAFGSGSFLVAAATEGRRYIGIEKNEEVHLFKKERINYMDVACERLKEVEESENQGKAPPPLLSVLHPSARAGRVHRRGAPDVEKMVGDNKRMAI